MSKENFLFLLNFWARSFTEESNKNTKLMIEIYKLVALLYEKI